MTMRHSMALLLWRHGQGALAKALVAVKLNRYIADDLEASEKMGSGLVMEFRSYCSEWESLSCT
jgi:transient receptor potential cation channel subfamily M protein 3